MSKEIIDLSWHVERTQCFHLMYSHWFLPKTKVFVGIFLWVSADNIGETQVFESLLLEKLTFAHRRDLSEDFLNLIKSFRRFLPMVSAKLILHSRQVRRNITLLAENFSSKYFYGFFQHPFFRSSQRVLATMSKELMFCSRHARQNLVFTAY